MRTLSARIILVAFGLTVSTAVSAEQVLLARLQCAPGPKATGASVVPTCPSAVNGSVSLEACTCPPDYLLVNLSAPASIPTVVPVPSSL